MAQQERVIVKTRVKICGITRVEDALFAANLGVDALGFVFYDKSPRCINTSAAAEIIRQLPPFMTTVGLFVNAEQSYIDTVVNVSGIDVIQLHGDESPEFCEAQNKSVIKALPVSSAQDLRSIADYSCTVLLDAKAPPRVYGGTGTAFDWALLNGLKHHHPLILAGGLEPANIDEALHLLDWYSVDVSSGVEQAKGIKDKDKMTLFCKKVHEFNCKV